MKFIDLFAGIGGFRLGMEQAGHECVAFCEIDKFARKSYKNIHNTDGEVEMHDITTVSDEFIRGIGDIDIICGGFPCQAFSIAGKRQGFEDTRGTLFFEIARFASILRPRYLFLENVKGLLNHEGGATFETILRTLDELGYDVEWQVLNSKHYVPQNRERVFIIGHLRGASARKIFPIGRESGSIVENDIKPLNNSKKTRELMKFDSTNRFYDISGISPCLNTMQGGDREPKVAILGNVNPSGRGMNGEVYLCNGLAPTLTTNKGEGNKTAIPVLTPDRLEKRQNGRRFKENGEPMFTLTSQDRHGVVINPLQGRTNNGWHFEQQVYDKTGIARAVKSGGGSGNIPKVIIDDTNTGYDDVRYYENIAPTLRASRTGLKVLEATKQGYSEAYPGDSVNIPHPNSETRRGRVGKQIANTLLTEEEQAVVTEEFRIRKLTPRECWRLQGFPDLAFDKAQEVNSDSQLYKQAGNSVTVPVIYDIARML